MSNIAAAHILFMSDEKLPCPPEEWALRLQNRYGTAVIVIGLGGEGALLAVKDDNFVERVPAVRTRPVVNRGGAGIFNGRCPQRSLSFRQR
jgi:ribokinase